MTALDNMLKERLLSGIRWTIPLLLVCLIVDSDYQIELLNRTQGGSESLGRRSAIALPETTIVPSLPNNLRGVKIRSAPHDCLFPASPIHVIAVSWRKITRMLGSLGI